MAPARTSARASTCSPSAASATSSSTCSTAARTPTSASGRRAPTALDQAEGALSEPGENGINQQLGEFWDSWSDLANANGNDVGAAKQAVVENGAALADAFNTVRAQIAQVKDQTYAQYSDLARPASPGDPGGEVAQIATDIAGLNDQIKRFITVGDVPNDLLDRRDQLLDQLSEYGQISVDGQSDGTINVSFVDSISSGTTYSVVTGANATWAGPPAGDAWSPGGKLGGLLDASKPGGTLDGYLSTLDTIANNLVSTVNGALGTSFFDGGAGPTAATHRRVRCAAREPARRSRPAPARPGSRRPRARRRRSCATAPASTRPTARSSRRSARTPARPTRQEANAQVLTDAVENRRQSVSGVSLDEEMSNLVRFQRSYQASARAMSTLDEMLDVLINRTGRVGL